MPNLLMNRYDASTEFVEYFVDRYSNILAFKANEFDSLHDGFIVYQLLSDEEIPAKVIEEATVTSKQKDGPQKTHLRMDTVWGYLSEAKSSSGPSRFPNLFPVAQLVLMLPHRNADKERAFSLIKKNKTEFRASMDLINRTLSSIISVKMNLDDPSYLYKPSKAVLKKTKHATKQYNQLHSCSAEVFKEKNALNKPSEEDTNNNQDDHADILFFQLHQSHPQHQQIPLFHP